MSISDVSKPNRPMAGIGAFAELTELPCGLLPEARPGTIGVIVEIDEAREVFFGHADREALHDDALGAQFVHGIVISHAEEDHEPVGQVGIETVFHLLLPV